MIWKNKQNIAADDQLKIIDKPIRETKKRIIRSWCATHSNKIPFKILINRYNNILNIVLINKNLSKKKQVTGINNFWNKIYRNKNKRREPALIHFSHLTSITLHIDLACVSLKKRCSVVSGRLLIIHIDASNIRDLILSIPRLEGAKCESKFIAGDFVEFFLVIFSPLSVTIWHTT